MSMGFKIPFGIFKFSFFKYLFTASFIVMPQGVNIFKISFEFSITYIYNWYIPKKIY